MTTIDPSFIITGEMTSEEDLVIHGRIRGPLSVRAVTLTIGERAHLDSHIRGARVVVHGTVRGTISATERIELHPSAVVTGDLSANQVVIADGAMFNGTIDMDRRTIAARVAQFKAGQSAAG